MSKKNTKGHELSEQEKRKLQLKQMKSKDVNHYKDDIFRLEEQLRELMQQKQAIEQQIDSKKRNDVKESFELEVQLKREEELSNEYENTLAELSDIKGAEVLALQKRHDREIDVNEASKAEVRNEKAKERQKLEQKVNYLNKYSQRYAKYVQDIEDLDRKMNNMEISQCNDIDKIKDQYQQNRCDMQANTQSQMQRIKQSERNKLQKKMNRDQFIKKENEVMQQEIALCSQQKQALLEECEQMSSEIQKEKSKNFQETLGNQANETYQRSLRIIKLQNKLNEIKTHFNEETIRLQKEYSNLDTIYERKVQEMRSRIVKVEGWLRIKGRNLKKLKDCSQMVLNQRTNLESYLLQVFYQHPEIEYKQKEHINSILRHLFAKINSKKPPLTYKNYLPEHKMH